MFSENTLPIVKALRAIPRKDSTSIADAQKQAKLQADRLLEMRAVRSAPVPNSLVTGLPHVRVQYIYGIPVSASTHWDGRDWVIILNLGERRVRQRFSLMHEFKHIIDHPFRPASVYTGSSALDEAESVADYFAACVLMPRDWVESAFASQTRSVEALADRFNVSKKAMTFRLAELHLAQDSSRPARRSPRGSDPANREALYRGSSNFRGASS